MLQTILTVVHIVLTIAVIVVVMLQDNKEAGLSGAIVGGQTESFFGKNKSRTKEGLLSRLTIYLSALFVISSIVLAILFK